jgi:cobalt-precorrin 5A hydrolase
MVTLYSEIPVEFLPPGLVQVDEIERADIIVSNRRLDSKALLLRPRNLVVGVGCNRGATAEEFDQALTEILGELRLSRLAIEKLTSISQKKDEQGLLEFAMSNHWPVDFFAAAALNAKAASLDSSEFSEFRLALSPAAMRAVGASHGVAEPAALVGAASNHLLSRKRKWKNVTLAIAQAFCMLSAPGLAPKNI